MNTFDDDIRNAVRAESETASLQSAGDEGMIQQVAATFRSRMRIWVLVIWVATAFWAGIGAWAALAFFRTNDMRDWIMYASIFLFAGMAVAMLKMWCWMEMNRNTHTREISAWNCSWRDSPSGQPNAALHLHSPSHTDAFVQVGFSRVGSVRCSAERTAFLSRLLSARLRVITILCVVIMLSAQASPPVGPPSGSPADPPIVSPSFKWDSGDEPLDDMNAAPPGAIEPPLNLIERDPSNWLGIPPEKELLNFVRDPLKRLNQDYGVLITGAYTMLYQQSIGTKARSAGAGDFDLTGRWTFLGRGTKDEGSIYVAGEYRHQIGTLTPAMLGPEIGTLLATSNGFNDRGFALKDAYYAQRLFDDHFRFGIGRVDPENLVGMTDLQSANTSFLNKAFSTNPTIAFPGAGFGAAATVRPVDWFYLAGGATNAYGNTTQISIDTLDEWRFFKFVEVGFTPSIEGVGTGKYRVALWHLDSRSLTAKPGDGGFSIIGDQKIGKDLSLFARYGYANGDLTSAKQSFQIGGGITGLVGSSNDLSGLAFAVSAPEDIGLRNEKVLEVFHRAQLTGRIQFTIGMQLIFDPSRAPDTDALGVLSVRLRLTF